MEYNISQYPNTKFVKMGLIKVVYIDQLNRKLEGFLFGGEYIKQSARLPLVKEYIDEQAKKIVKFKRVTGFLPISVELINSIDFNYHE